MEITGVFDTVRTAVVSGILDHIQRDMFKALSISGLSQERFCQTVADAVKAGGVMVQSVSVEKERVVVKSHVDGVLHTSVLTTSDVLEFLPSLRRNNGGTQSVASRKNGIGN